MKFALFFLALLLIAPSARAEIKPLDKDLGTFNYPLPVSYYNFKAQNQNLRMAFIDAKPSGAANGKTVVLLHGKNFGANYWERTINDLTAQGYRVIAPDQIGFGKSTKPEHLQYSFFALAQWTHNLLKENGVDKFYLVGHSMGGMLATRMTLLYPHDVEKLALVNPIGLEDYRVISPYTSVDEWYARELKASPESFKEYQQKVYFAGQWKPEYDKLVEIPSGWVTGPDWALIAYNSALQYDMIYTQPVVYEFGNLKLPTLLLIGTRDRTAINRDNIKNEALKAKVGRYDILGRTTKNRIRNAQLVEFPDAGHMPQVEVYDDYIAALIKFLNGTPEKN